MRPRETGPRPRTSPTLLLRCRVVTAAPPDSPERGPRVEHVWEIYDQRPAHRRGHLAHRRLHAENGAVQQVVTQLELGDWLGLCQSGHPMALDVMFAPEEDAQIDRIRGLRMTYRAELAAAKKTFEAAMKADPGERQRLAYNLAALSRWGRYDPTEWIRTSRAQQRMGAAA